MQSLHPFLQSSHHPSLSSSITSQLHILRLLLRRGRKQVQAKRARIRVHTHILHKPEPRLTARRGTHLHDDVPALRTREQINRVRLPGPDGRAVVAVRDIRHAILRSIPAHGALQARELDHPGARDVDLRFGIFTVCLGVRDQEHELARLPRGAGRHAEAEDTRDARGRLAEIRGPEGFARVRAVHGDYEVRARPLAGQLAGTGLG